MICPKCKQRMRCYDSYNDAELMKTARRYICDTCGKKIHTFETVADALEVSYLFCKKQEKRGRRKNEIP